MSQQQFPIVEPADTAALIGIKEVRCVPGEECNGLPAPTEFTLKVVPSGEEPIAVDGSSEGIPVPLPPGDYQVNEDPDPPEGDLVNFVSIGPGNGCNSASSEDL